MQRIDVSGVHRRGVLTHAGVLLAHAHLTSTSPVKRGVLVRRRILCQTLPPPPPGVMVTVGSPDEPRTTRERYSQHSADLACAGCHARIDPPGFAFEGFDAIGEARTHENGFPVDTTGTLTLAGTATGDFKDAAEMMGRVAQTQEAADCFTRQLATFVLGREPGAQDECSLQRARHRSLSAGGDVVEALKGLVGSEAFITRAEP
jgi:hypothetical protein